MKALAVALAAAAAVALAASGPAPIETSGDTGAAARPPAKERALPRLSGYGFFEGPLAEMRPAANVHPYALNTPLFSDYAEKARFAYVPPDSALDWRDREVLAMPVGTVLIKHFYYSADQRDSTGARRLIETRLLKHTPGGWLAWGYWWNDDQTDADYRPLGGKTAVDFVDARGDRRHIDYRAPNQIQCKSCHSYAGEVRPIGPSARQLHGGEHSYLSDWVEEGLVRGAPSGKTDWPVMDWRAPGVTAEVAARAYLDANCGYCHRHEGPASTSGLMLAWHYPTGAQTGVRKSPVAAGKGSGGRRFDIAPGDPEGSILYHRMASDDPAVRMPEVGRSVAHDEGLAVVKAWIETL